MLGERGIRGFVVGLVALGALAFAPGANAAITEVFDGEATGGGSISCDAPDSNGYRFCGGPNTTVESFDGNAIDVNVAFPPEPAIGPDGNFPLIGIFHGWGGQELKLSDFERFLERGYAVFSMSDRGWDYSCGKDQPRREPGCEVNSYNRLMDTRYEVRDAQDFFGVLVDEGVVDPDRIGATGGSYGGGLAMSLAALKNRQMEPNGDLIPWESPGGTPLSLAAAAPEIPWTDLAYSLVPNGGTLDYTADSNYFKRGQFGVLKESFVSALYAVGVGTSNFDAIPPIDPDAAVDQWYALLTAGEPYDGNPAAEDIADEVTENHSSYYIEDSVEPAPIMISNGWTDDLFPVDEALRFYNKTLDRHPDADIAMMFLDYGHMRGQNKDADIDLLREKEYEWLDFYVKGEGSKPNNDVVALTQTCDGASDGPFTAPTWRELSPGEIVFRGDETKVISASAPNPSGRSFDPVAGGGACAITSGADDPGVATYRLDPAPAGGYTLAGSPTIIADILSTAPNNQLAYRLLDVDADGQQTLVSRGLYRPDDNGDAATRQVFQSHPNAYKFDQGHVAKLELRPSDEPYGRVSNAQGPITVANLELRLPVLESPDGGLVSEPAAKFVPDGYALAPGYGAAASQDSDGDGIADSDDSCPDQAGPASSDGCPDGSESTDSDGDGIADQNDACPNDAGPSSNAGCPEGTDPADPGDPRDPVAPSICKTTADSADDSQAGTDDGETLVGTPGNDLINGNGGRDTLVGLEGDDCLTGDDDRDTIRGKDGDDDATGGKGGDFMKGNKGDDSFAGGNGRDRIRLAGGKDLGIGGNGKDNIATGDGRDTIRGGAGPDRLFGNDGNDKIRGGTGDDVLFGGGGPKNVLNGGPGKDRCIISSRAKNKVRNCEKVLIGGARG